MTSGFLCLTGYIIRKLDCAQYLRTNIAFQTTMKQVLARLIPCLEDGRFAVACSLPELLRRPYAC